jgi:hypothetical protein
VFVGGARHPMMHSGSRNTFRFEVAFGDGPLGLNLCALLPGNGDVYVSGFPQTKRSAALEGSVLWAGDILVAIGTKRIVKMNLQQVSALISSSARPVTLTFEVSARPTLAVPSPMQNHQPRTPPSPPPPRVSARATSRRTVTTSTRCWPTRARRNSTCASCARGRRSAAPRSSSCSCSRPACSRSGPAPPAATAPAGPRSRPTASTPTASR